MFRILKKLKKDFKNNRKIFAFDVETEQIKHDTYIEQKFICGSVVGDGIKPFFSKDKKDLADYMLSWPFRNSYIYATNLEFDFMHIFQDDKRMKDMFMIDRHGIIYCCYRKNKDKHSFLDTWNYTGKMKLEKMGEWLSLPKLKQPKAFLRKPSTYDEWEEMKAYNIRDSEITYRFAKFYCNDFCNMINAKPKITLASTGMDFWRRNHQPIDIFQEKRNIIDIHFQGSVHGGRTECFQRGFFNFPHYYYDFNSHYPACCKEGIDGKGSYPNPSTSRYSGHVTLNMIQNYEGISRVDVFCPQMHIPLLGITNKDGKYIFPRGNISGWFTNIELRQALKLGYEIQKIHEGVYYLENFKPFRSAVTQLYDLRLKYKKEDNDIMQSMTKVLMNSALFGKFAQKIDTKTIIHNIENLHVDNIGRLFFEKKDKKIFIQDFNKRGNFIFESIKRPRRIPIFIMPILASYTTALARIKLHRYMMKDYSSVIYCDTDSIVTMKRSFDTSDRLGDMKLENKIDHSVFIKPKFYFINNGLYDIFKSKGIGKIKDKHAFDDLLLSKKVSRQRFLKFKESFIRKLPFSSIVDSPKTITLEDDKRDWGKNLFTLEYSATSRPLTV